MNESIRTMIFVGIAVVVCGIAAWKSPRLSRPETVEGSLVAPFEVADANTLRIVHYDADERNLDTFEVTRSGNRWTIPSHGGYPADAEAQLKKIAGLFVELKPITKVSDSPASHAEFGVKEPVADISDDPKGYGRMVTISDADGTPLLQLIVGKKSAEPPGSTTNRELHFVRSAKANEVYVAELPVEALTTKFEDWIERDLLQLNAFDVARLDLRDYSLLPFRTQQGVVLRLLPRMDTLVAWDSATSRWNLEKMTVYQGNDALEGELAEDEELNKAKLDGIKNTVDDLKIIDVERKPRVLADALKDESLLQDEQAMLELQRYGFFPFSAGGQPQVYGSNGGLRISMKDGVRYILNFGDAKSAEKGDSSKLNRYLMVTAEVDEAMIPKPELEPEEPEPAGPEPPAASTREEGSGADGESQETKGEEDPGADDAAKKERERIKKRNQQKLDKYHDDQKKAADRVAELNARFGNWFYVVSDDVYKKVQLGRADLVKDRETAKDEGFGVDAFRSLEAGGIEGKAAATPPRPPTGFPPGFPDDDE